MPPAGCQLLSRVEACRVRVLHACFYMICLENPMLGVPGVTLPHPSTLGSLPRVRDGFQTPRYEIVVVATVLLPKLCAPT
jgi:hypothetical protein